tara:strand:+ start:1504 stop:1860 length:357 start_codon:yes stop_codon:yes gene_type:complete
MYNYEIDICYNTVDEYQAEFLRVFRVNDWDENAISSGRYELYTILKEEPCFKDIFSYACKNSFFKNNDDDTEWGLVRLFAADTFYEFHACIKEYFTNKKVSKETNFHINKLKELMDIP